jgi:hypothetical protein
LHETCRDNYRQAVYFANLLILAQAGQRSLNQAIMLYGDFAVEAGRRDRHLYRDDPPRRGQLKAGMLKN